MRKRGPSYFHSQQTDKATKYLYEGRRLQNVKLQTLTRALNEAGQLLVLQPTDQEVVDIYKDLQSELDLRGVEPLIGVARSHVLDFGRAMADFFEEVKLDSPAKYFGGDQRTIDALKFLLAISAPAN